MPVAKYYCDYCDKMFQDTVVARRRHLQGAMHQRAKRLWFESFKESVRFEAEAATKALCMQFMRKGFCQYGKHCKYQHVPPYQSQFLNQSDFKTEQLSATLLSLPPSLRPPPESGYPSLPLVDWG